MGQIYRRKYKNKTGEVYEGSTYWVKYYRHGRPYRESTHSSSFKKAERFLKICEVQILENRFSGLKIQKVKLDELAADFLNDYKTNGRKSTRRAQSSMKHLQGFFEGMRAIDITTDRVRAYVLQRQKEGAQNATVNRELAALKRMFSLASEMTPPKVTSIPHIPRLMEGPARAGYFEHDQYLALRKALPSYLKPVASMAYHTGMRREEILGLEWSQIDLMNGKIVLKAENTKTSEARVIYMKGELLEVIHFQRALRDQKHPNCPWVFFMKSGERIKSFRGSWNKACLEAGLSEILTDAQGLPVMNRRGEDVRIATKLFHDFRRTAIRNMVRSGTPELICMKVSGHKTRSVFERYDITSEKDLELASRKLEIYHQAERAKLEKGHHLGTGTPEGAELQLEEGAATH